MCVPFAEALGQVDLEAGQGCRCQLRGYGVELRVWGPTEARRSALLNGEDVMLDPWIEFPYQPSTRP